MPYNIWGAAACGLLKDGNGGFWGVFLGIFDASS